MEENWIEMSQRERDRLKVMAVVLSGDRTQGEAGRLLKRSVRQVRRIQRRLEREGDGGVIHKFRGRPSNRRKDPELRQAVLEAYRQRYPDFGPTFASEKLAEEGLPIAPETLRRWLGAQGLVSSRRKRDKHRSRRARRACLGELVQAEDLAAILSVQQRRKVTNDYTIRLENQVYQLFKPVHPGQRGGWVTVEQRRDGTLHIRFGRHYLAYHEIGRATRAKRDSGALPPDPRSLPLSRTPAERRKREGRAEATTQPSAVRPVSGRSGRTPAEPYPPEDEQEPTAKKPWRPPPEHPWKKKFLASEERNRTLLSSETTGHSQWGMTARLRPGFQTSPSRPSRAARARTERAGSQRSPMGTIGR